MSVKYYTYKVEFQARGAGHIHGTLWMDLDKLETLVRKNGKLVVPEEKDSSELRPFKGIKEAFKNLRNNEGLSKNNIKVLTSFADEFTTVTTHKGSVGEDVSDIARNVNVHHHTHTCRKYNDECRFGFEKLPSPETLVGQPVKGDQETKKKILKKCFETITRVKKVLADKEKMENIMKKFNKDAESPEQYEQKRFQRIEMVLREASVTMSDYKMALKTKQNGYSIVLARDIDETMINNFNVEWLRAWNANIDVQICLDFHAVVTYITDYYSKCETELVKLIKAALEKSDETDNKERMKIVSNVFQRSRQMGEAEAVYKLIPSMALTNSNVTCQWVTIGPAEERSFRYQKAQQHHLDAGIPLTELDGHEGLWYQQQDIWSKYLRRSDALKTICFAQFAKMYRSSSKRATEDEDRDENDEDISGDADSAENLSKFHYIMTYEKDVARPVELPELIQLKQPYPGEASIMQRRRSPAALRFHKIKEKNNSDRYLFGEVMLYYPLVKDIKIEQARQLYQDTYKGKRKVDIVKCQVMEFLEGVQEARYHLEMLEDDANLSDVAKLLDPQGEKDNEECDELEVEISEFDHLNPDDLILRKDKLSSSGLYKKIEIPAYDELRKNTRCLDEHQRGVLDIVIKYVKDVVKNRKTQNKLPQPPYLMMHGGAGSGKSTTIRIIAQWAQKILQQEGQSPDCPSVIITAFCGTAASNVDGQTLHSSLGFTYKNDHHSLGDKTRDMRRAILKYLKLLIIDEISMVKADMLYQLDLRLQEIKEKVGVPFGGIGVLCFGDLMQLPPVQGRYIFDEPSNKEFLITHGLTPRWRMFNPILLEKNHRQGSDATYADLLNRIRIKQHTADDVEILSKRVRSSSHEDMKNVGLHITAKRDPCDKLNQKYRVSHKK